MTRLLLSLAFLLLSAVGASAQTADQLYEEGKALYDKKKYDQAFPLLMKAAEQGHKKAEYRVGRCYAKGHGVAENDEVAFQWYQKSANQGFAKAQYRLGKAYLKGKGVKADQHVAEQWLRKAVSNPKGGDKVMKKIREEKIAGDKDAKEILKLLGM